MRPLPLISLIALSTLSSACLSFQSTAPRGQGLVTLQSRAIHLEERGSGEPVLLVHGYCGSTGHWARMMPGLAARRRVLAVDLPGFGGSDRRRGDYSVKEQARVLWQLLDRKGIRSINIVAHSFGTGVALAMALQAPQRVKSLALVGVFAYEDQLPSFIRWSRAPLLGEALFWLFFDQRLDDRMGMAFSSVATHVGPDGVTRARKTLHEPGALAAALAVARGMRFAELQKHYHSLSMPTLILHGERDPVTRKAWALRLYSELRDAQLKVLPGAHHMGIYTQPRRVIRHLFAFWSEVK